MGCFLLESISLQEAPKIGKSFLVAQIAFHVSTGQKFWDYEVHQGTVLYLALEDGQRRLQQILIVHHTRKQPAGDSFEMISGTTGLLGCADGALLMQRANFGSSHQTLF